MRQVNLPNNGNNHRAPNADEAVNRITTALAAARKERDDLHRRKELSCERLRLLHEDRGNLHKTVRDMQEKLVQLQESGKLENEIQALKQAVQHMTRQAAFHHAELLDKREKVAQQMAAMKEGAQSRANHKHKVNVRLSKTREELSIRQAHAAKLVNMDTQMELIKIEMEEVNSERLWNSWPRIIDQRAVALALKAEALQRGKGLRRVVEGYEYLYGDEIVAATDGNDVTMMEA